MCTIVMLVWSWSLTATRHAHLPRGRRCDGDEGQTTAEYALMLIAAAALAVVVIGWISKTDAIGRLFDTVIKHVTGNVGR